MTRLVASRGGTDFDTIKANDLDWEEYHSILLLNHPDHKLNDLLSSLLQGLSAYRDLGRSALGLLREGDIDAADLLLEQRAAVFSDFCQKERDVEQAGLAWTKIHMFVDLWSEIQSVDQDLSRELGSCLDELARDVGRLAEARRTLKSYHSGETGNHLFTGMA